MCFSFTSIESIKESMLVQTNSRRPCEGIETIDFSVPEQVDYFVEKVREFHGREETRENAVELAIKDCIEHQVLTDFFQSRKDEVIKMTHLDFTWERREELIRKEEREEGRREGRLENLRNMLAAGIDDEILRVAGFTTEEIEREKTRK